MPCNGFVMVADCCVYARVGCQQNPLIVRSQSKRMESYAGIRHTLQLSMLFGSMVCDAFQTVYGFVTQRVIDASETACRVYGTTPVAWLYRHDRHIRLLP